MGIDPQLILMDEAALSSEMRASARTRWVNNSGWAMRHIFDSIYGDAIVL
jgi:hypothetical protein